MELNYALVYDEENQTNMKTIISIEARNMRGTGQ